MAETNSPEQSDSQKAVFELHARVEQMDDARDVVSNVARTMVSNGMDAHDVAKVLEDVVKTLKNNS